LNATKPKYAKHYNMLTHVSLELPQVIEAAGLPIARLYLSCNWINFLNFVQDFSRQSIFGHSMGGHGALTLYLSSLLKTKQYRAASAFAPIANPTKSPWGIKAFTGYLQGGVEEAKATYDATELIAGESKLKNEKLNIFIDYVFSQTSLTRTRT
jgi:S-formylglutathione hydrolase